MLNFDIFWARSKSETTEIGTAQLKAMSAQLDALVLDLYFDEHEQVVEKALTLYWIENWLSGNFAGVGALNVGRKDDDRRIYQPHAVDTHGRLIIED